MNAQPTAAVAVLVGTALVAGQAAAQNSPQQAVTTLVEYGSGEQGSALFAPYDLTGNNETVLRIVNAGPDTQSLHVVRVCHGIKFVDDTCRKVDMSIILTANETRIFNVGEDTTNPGPNCDFGFIAVYAETSFFSKVPELYNHLYGDVTITNLAGGRRSGQAPMAAVKCLVPDDGVADTATPCGTAASPAEAGVLPFNGISFERLHKKLKTTFRAGLNSTRQSVLYLVTATTTAGAQHPPTVISFDRYSQDEAPASGSLEYICAARLETSDQNVVPTLHQGSVATPNGTVKLQSVTTQFDDALFGWELREAGKGKRTMKAMWINEKTTTGMVFGFAWDPVFCAFPQSNGTFFGVHCANNLNLSN